jgi:hypothetical protein
VTTPSGRHLDFALSATVPDATFSKTLKYYKQHKGKENSPSKNGRKASLPEEIAELAREAIEEGDLDKYRKMDLAPMEPVMESNTAGDLITFGTPVKSNISSLAVGSYMSSRGATAADDFVVDDNSDTLAAAENVDGDTEDARSSYTKAMSPLSDEVESKGVNGLASTESYATSTQEETLQNLYPQHPPFITVISLLPKAMFWVVAIPIAKYSNKAYNALVDRFANLSVSGGG